MNEREKKMIRNYVNLIEELTFELVSKIKSRERSPIKKEEPYYFPSIRCENISDDKQLIEKKKKKNTQN